MRLLIAAVAAALVSFSPPGEAAEIQPALARGQPVGGLPTLSGLVDSVKGAVVNVEVRGRASNPQAEMLERFFGGRGGQAPPTRGAGSGFLIEGGAVLTNSHVVQGATTIRVKLDDGREFDAKVLGTDPLTDLALLELKGDVKNLPGLSLGDSDAVKVGDWVVAIGNPFGLASSVSAGILSAKARNIGAGPYDDFLQTDAAINPGNSGGPLFNLEGEVIGINTAIVGGGTGIGFAVPSNFAKVLIPQLRAGEVKRGWLGVSIQDLTPELASALKVPVEHGAVVSDVQPDTPGAKGGLKTEDVVVALHGRPVVSAMELSRAVGFMKPGELVKLDVYRGERRLALELKLGKRPDIEGMAREPSGAAPPESVAKLGLTFESAANRIKGASGALVTQVEPGSIAERANLMPGMIIVEADGKPVRTAEDLQHIIVSKRGNEPLLLRIRVDGGKLLRALPIS